MEFRLFSATTRFCLVILGGMALSLPLAAQPTASIPIHPGDLDPRVNGCTRRTHRRQHRWEDSRAIA